MTDQFFPGAQSFPEVMQRTIQLVGRNAPKSVLQELAEVFRSLRWDFQDCGLQIYLLVDQAGDISCLREWQGPVDSVFSMDAATFHQAAYGKTNFGAAFLMGKLRIEGISPLSLSKFTPLLKPFLDSYRQACAEFHGPGT